ncbi:hypothetical protein CFAM422_005798 [Trichoderma lentiforme]|uniref:Uncharacterized protein n=1 Tax=Trichoderma lentiforme TaxID=1567552 RepID=A0A9P4XG45_9HYPO|nr:hypothetical protein CFAM422_005798 [Trichoderma lentiforme]
MVRCVVGLGPQKITRLPLARGAEAVDFSENPSGRTVGIYFGLIFFKWQTQDLQTSLCQRLDEIQHLESNCDENLRDTGHDAYSAIEHVVTELLTIERGAARIERVDKSIVVKLDLVTKRFIHLCELGRQVVWNVGTRATMCMADGDNATRFVFTLESEMRALEIQCAAVRDTKIEHEKSLRLYQALEGERQRRVYLARDVASSWSNRLLGFFSGSTRERLKRDVEEAEQRLHMNLYQQRAACDSIEALHRLEMFHQETWTGMGNLRDKAQSVAGSFKHEFKRVTEVKEVKDKVFENLLNLRNKIQDPEFRTTRDSSLRLVMELFRTDDDSWCGQGCVGFLEQKITEAICNRRLEAEEEGEVTTTPVLVVDASDF